MTEHHNQLTSYAKHIDFLINSITKLMKEIMAEIAIGGDIDNSKIENYSKLLKNLIGNKSQIDVICKLIDIQIKIAKIPTPVSKERGLTFSEEHLQNLYAYYRDRYEKEELYRKRLCSACGQEQGFYDHLASNRQVEVSFTDYLSKIQANKKL